MDEQISKAFWVVVGLWILGALVSLALVVGAVIVAIHFIQKWW